MATGSVPLLLAADSDYNRSPLARGVVDYLIAESPIIEMVPWIPFDGEAFVSREQNARPTVGFRQVNATYTKTYGSERRHFWGVTICGGEVFIDNFIVRTRRNSAATKANQYASVSRHAARFLDRQVIDGDGTSDSFYGVNALIDLGFGQENSAAAAGAKLSTAGLDYLDESIDLVRVGKPDAMWLNRACRRAITKLGRNTSAGYSMIDVGNDAFGRQVTMYDGIPMRIIGDDETGSQILDFDETSSDGSSSSVTTSMYLTKFDTGDEQTGFTGLLGAGGTMEVVDFGETEAAPGHLGRIEFYPGIAILNKFSVVRMSSILAE